MEASNIWPHVLNYSQSVEMDQTCVEELYSEPTCATGKESGAVFIQWLLFFDTCCCHLLSNILKGSRNVTKKNDLTIFFL